MEMTVLLFAEHVLFGHRTEDLEITCHTDHERKAQIVLFTETWWTTPHEQVTSHHYLCILKASNKLSSVLLLYASAA